MTALEICEADAEIEKKNQERREKNEKEAERMEISAAEMNRFMPRPRDQHQLEEPNEL